MEEEIFDLNSLGNLLLRVVRGGKPGTFNAESSGNIYVESDNLPDGLDVKEYLIQASLASNIYSGTASFTVGSTTVTGSGFSELNSDDVIKLDSNPTQFTIDAVQSDTQLTLKSNYTSSDGSGTGQYTAKKILFGSASYDLIQNTVDTQNFEFNSEKGIWEILDGSGSTTLPTSSSDFVDGITVNFISKGEDGKPDFQIIGTIEEKSLPTVQLDTTQAVLDPIPYPGDHSSLSVSVRFPGETSFKGLEYNEDYVVQYANSPMYETPLPPFEDRKQAKIMLLASSNTTQEVTSLFSGQINITDGDIDVTNILEDSETVSLNGSELTKYEDYVVDETPGVLTLVSSQIDESPVDSILYENNVLNNGIEFYLGSGTFDSPDFTDAPLLRKNVDFNINENTGVFRMVEGLTTDQILKISYMVEGQPIEQVLKSSVGEDVTDLRTDRFPIMPGTVTLTQTNDNGKVVALLENEDFFLSYATGIISLIDSSNTKGLNIIYVPVSTVTCMAKSVASNPDLFTIKMVNDPTVALSSSSTRFFNTSLSEDDESNIDASDITITNSNGTVLPLASSKYSNTSKTLQFASTDSISKGDVLYASYQYVTDVLPYAPMITLSRTFFGGESNFIIEDTDLTNTLDKDYVIRLKPQDTGKPQFYRVSNVSIPNGVNTVVGIYGSFSEDIRDPEFLMSDDKVSMESVGYSAYPIGYGNTEIVFQGDMSPFIKVGKVLIIDGQYVHPITGFNVSEGETWVTIGTPTVKDFDGSSVLDSIEISSSILYLDSDTAIVTSYPIINAPQPVLKINHLKATSDDSLESNSATIVITSDQIQLTETLNGVDSGIDPIGYLNLENLSSIKTAIESILTGTDNTQAFSVDWIIEDGTDIKSQYLVPSKIGVEPTISLPYDLTTSTQVLRKNIGDTSYTALVQGDAPGLADFTIIDGIIVLEESLSQGDRFLVTYQGVNSLNDQIGSTIDITTRYFANIPKNTEFKVGLEYLSPDQYYIQTMTEASFFNDVAFPKLEELKKRKKGPASFGRENNSVSSKGNAEGGIEDNYYLLRDEEIKKVLYEKVFNYYAERLGFFGKEELNIIGVKIANNDFTLSTDDVRYNMVATKDIDHTSAFSYSKLFPVGYDLLSAKPDERFETLYTSYGEANFINYEGSGVVLGDNPEWLTRQISAGDQIRIKGREEFYTIDTITDNTITLLEAISNISEKEIILQDGVYHEVSFDFSEGTIGGPVLEEVSRTGYSYEIQFSQAREFPLFDNTGFTGARAETANSEPYPLSRSASYSNIFVIEYSLDRGATWGNFIEVNMSSLSAPFTSEKVASLLLVELESVFKVSVENVYNQYATDTSASNDLSYPFNRVEKEEFVGVREAIIIRGNKNTTWFRFPEPEEVINTDFGFGSKSFTVKKEGSKLLGFPKGTDTEGVWFSGNTTADNAHTKALIESAEQTTKLNLLNGMVAETNKFSRTNQGKYEEPLKASLSSLVGYISAPVNNLGDAKIAAESIALEDSASSAIETSYNQAITAIENYDDDLSNINTASSQNQELINNTDSKYDEYTMDHRFITLSRQDASDILAQALQGGNPDLQLSAEGLDADDPRILIGDGTYSANVSFDGVGYDVFPYYLSNNNMLGLYDRHPFAEWDNIPTAADAMRLDIKVNNNFRYEVTTEYLKLEYYVAPDNSDELTLIYQFTDYPTVGELVDGINADTDDFSGSIIYGPIDNPTSDQRGQSRAVPTSFLKQESLTSTYSLSKRFSADPVPYSASRDKSIVFDQAILISGSSGFNSYQTEDESITLMSVIAGNTTTTQLMYADYDTLGDLIPAINSVAGFSASADSFGKSFYKYGTFIRTGGAVDITSNSSNIYFGAKGDIRFHTISNKNINEDIEESSVRIGQLNDSMSYYEVRSGQISISVGSNGEKLKNFQNLWVNRIVHKEEGPCAQIQVLKEQLIRAEEETSL